MAVSVGVLFVGNLSQARLESYLPRTKGERPVCCSTHKRQGQLLEYTDLHMPTGPEAFPIPTFLYQVNDVAGQEGAALARAPMPRPI